MSYTKEGMKRFFFNLHIEAVCGEQGGILMVVKGWSRSESAQSKNLCSLHLLLSLRRVHPGLLLSMFICGTEGEQAPQNGVTLVPSLCPYSFPPFLPLPLPPFLSPFLLCMHTIIFFSSAILFISFFIFNFYFHSNLEFPCISEDSQWIGRESTAFFIILWTRQVIQGSNTGISCLLFPRNWT